MIGTLTISMIGCGNSDGGSNSGKSLEKDSDGDGFNDAIDPAPNDASNPGDFSSPEKILAHPKIKEVLRKAKENGVAMTTELGHNPPNLTGYWKSNIGGTIIATDTGKSVLDSLAANEVRILTNGERYESAKVLYLEVSVLRGEEAIAYSQEKGSFFRGTGNKFTIYSPYKVTCTESGSNYARYGVSIESTEQSTYGGTIIINERINTNIILGSSGKLTVACDERLVGGGKSKWSIGYFVSKFKIEDANDLTYMCVNDDKAYIPEETWTNSDNQSCKCTIDYEVECK